MKLQTLTASSCKRNKIIIKTTRICNENAKKLAHRDMHESMSAFEHLHVWKWAVNIFETIISNQNWKFKCKHVNSVSKMHTKIIQCELEIKKIVFI